MSSTGRIEKNESGWSGQLGNLERHVAASQ